MAAMASGKRLTFEDISRLHERQEEIKRANSDYLGKHPELKNLIADFTAAILMQKPDDVYKFARDHFSVFLKGKSQSEDASGVYFGKHVITGRRYEVIISATSDRAQWLQVTAKDISNDESTATGSFSTSEILSTFGLVKADPEEAGLRLAWSLAIQDGKVVISSDRNASPTLDEFDASVKIQAISRARRDRAQHQERLAREAAAKKIQGQQRKKASVKRVEELKESNRAASKIQAVYRGNAARQPKP